MIKSKCFRIATGLEVSFSFSPEAKALTANWCPATPTVLAGQALRRYRLARDEFARVVAASLGGMVLVAELGGEQISVINAPKAGHA